MATSDNAEPSETLLQDVGRQLDLFASHNFKVNELKENVIISRTRGPDPLGTQFTLDPSDKERGNQELAAFKEYISSLKFAYLETNNKLQFVSHVFRDDAFEPITSLENEQLERKRIATKSELKARKVRVLELEEDIKSEAKKLENRFNQASLDASVVKELSEECERLEVQLAVIRNQRTPTQRATIIEAQEICERQEMSLASYGPSIKATEQKIKETKTHIKLLKSSIERLEKERRELKRELDEGAMSGMRDERAERQCRWYTNMTHVYKKLLGIENVETRGNPAEEVLITFAPNRGSRGVSKTLLIKLDSRGRMVDGYLVDSSDAIDDLVTRFVAPQDVSGLVLEVRRRFNV